MSRPLSWYPLASSDPVPGDPATVRAGGEHYEEVATAISDAERVLRALVDAQDAVSEAVDAIRERTHAVADRIRTAHRRYRSVGAALSTYAIELDAAQADSLAALRTAQAAQHRLDVAEDAVRRWRTLAEDAADLGEDDTTQQRALTAARSDRDDAEVTLAHARAALEDAVSRRDAAARWTMDAIDAGTQDTLDDGWWQDWGADVAQVVSMWAGNISACLGVASLFLGWVPVLGQILAVAALVAAGAALIADVALALKRGDGGDWFNVGMGVLGFLSFGTSRYLSRALDAFQIAAPKAALQAQGLTSVARGGSTGTRSLLATPLVRPTVTATKGRAAAWTNDVRAAWSRIDALHGRDRLLAMAGHVDLVRQNNTLRASLSDAFPARPLATMVLIGPTVQGAVLEAGAAVLYVGDVAMGYTSVSKAVVESAIGGAPHAASRLDL